MQLNFKTFRVECFNVGCAVDGWTENVIVCHSDNHVSCTGKLLYVFLREICIFVFFGQKRQAVFVSVSAEK